MKRISLALALSASLVSPALADFVVVPSGVLGDAQNPAIGAIAGSDVSTQLLGLGFVHASIGGTLFVDSPATVTFYALGSEGVYDNAFVVNGTQLFAEVDAGVALYDASAPIGSADYSGSIADLLFTIVDAHGGPGSNAAIGQNGFAIFYNSAAPGNVIAFGFDDGGANADGDYDDLVILARLTAPIPEPATWSLAILGFAALAWLRRRMSLRATG